jgi:hypothetical protein
MDLPAEAEMDIACSMEKQRIRAAVISLALNRR